MVVLVLVEEDQVQIELHAELVAHGAPRPLVDGVVDTGTVLIHGPRCLGGGVLPDVLAHLKFRR